MIEKLKELRSEFGISQKRLGEIIGVSQQSINKYENCNVEPDIRTLIQMARYFHTSVDYLIGNTRVKQESPDSSSCCLNEEEYLLVAHYRILSSPEKESIRLTIDNYLQNKADCGKGQ